MALLSYLDKKKKKYFSKTNSIDTIDIKVNPEMKYNLEEDKYFDDDAYFKLLYNRPDYRLYVDGDYYYAYNDSYQTEEGYKLRELLLFVWWVKIKKGRNLDTNIPRYFYDRYHINPNTTTNKFLEDNFIEIDENNIVRLTDKGKEIQSKYKDLWAIHSLKNYYANLDDEFPSWNLNKFLIKKHTQSINYHKANAQYHKELLDYFRQSNPQDVDQINYFQDQVTHDLNLITQLKAEIEALSE